MLTTLATLTTLALATPTALDAPPGAIVYRAWALDDGILALVRTDRPTVAPETDASGRPRRSKARLSTRKERYDYHWLRWDADGALLASVDAPGRGGVPSDDGRYLAGWSSTPDGERDWVVWTAALEEVGHGGCETTCMPTWQPTGSTLAVPTAGVLRLFDAKRGKTVSAEHPAAFRSQWSPDGSHICLPDAVLTPKGKVVAELDPDEAGIEPGGFSLEGCGRGELAGYGTRLGTPRGLQISRGEAIAQGVAVAVHVDGRGSHPTTTLDTSFLPPRVASRFRQDTLDRGPGGRPIHPLGDGRVVWSDPDGVWLAATPSAVPGSE